MKGGGCTEQFILLCAQTPNKVFMTRQKAKVVNRKSNILTHDCTEWCDISMKLSNTTYKTTIKYQKICFKNQAISKVRFLLNINYRKRQAALSILQ